MDGMLSILYIISCLKSMLTLESLSMLLNQLSQMNNI